ncbi:MAG: NADH dehydrogenase [Rhodospirillales bacterium RIFCSPLOWO2_12_FULL_58_28]|nr:MAG: NADH dehydrogenase [Rhodospirillales bacterium RIFCSPLOWO2_02_FULL_58_16]OHC79062.1 MAG: NADH dehydrogenase [Rhodospirillales bacterium RIFCSPLOWO2_12_FULL_58_28]
MRDIKQPAGFAFTEENVKKADEYVAKYPKGRQASAVMPLLYLAQRQNDNWLPPAAMDYVAEFLGMEPIRVYEIANFYTMYNLKPVGRYHIQVCTSICCMLRGSDDIVASCKKVTGVEFGGTSDDGMFTLSEMECLGACVNAPMMQINDDCYEDLDQGSAESVLNTLRIGGAPKVGPQSARKGSEPGPLKGKG